MKTILATLDGSEFSRAVLEVLSSVFGQEGATVHLLTVAAPPHESGPAGPRRADFRPSAGAQDAPGVSPAAWFSPQEPRLQETGDQAIDRVLQEHRDVLEQDARWLRDKGFAVECGVVVGNDPAAAIVDVARERGADIIAMATHGRGGLGRLVQGSVASKVVQSGVAPVLLIRPKNV